MPPQTRSYLPNIKIVPISPILEHQVVISVINNFCSSWMIKNQVKNKGKRYKERCRWEKVWRLKDLTVNDDAIPPKPCKSTTLKVLHSWGINSALIDLVVDAKLSSHVFLLPLPGTSHYLFRVRPWSSVLHRPMCHWCPISLPETGQWQVSLNKSRTHQ